MSADFIAEGDQFGWNDLTKAAAAATCGQAMDVPDRILYFTELLSIWVWDGEAIGEYAARISTPGAVISGYNKMAYFINLIDVTRHIHRYLG